MSTSTWPPRAKARAVQNIAAPEPAARAVADNLEYQDNVKNEFYHAGPVALIKLSDYERNGLNLHAINDDETRRSLAAKYEGVFDAATQAIHDIARNKEALSIHGTMDELKHTYEAGEATLRETAREWKHYDLQQKTRRDGVETLFT